MTKRSSRLHWGEFSDLQNAKDEVTNCYSIMSLEKKAKLESLRTVEEKPPVKRQVHCLSIVSKESQLNYRFFSLVIENHLVTQTVELMNHTERVKSMIDAYNEEMVRDLFQPWTHSENTFLFIYRRIWLASGKFFHRSHCQLRLEHVSMNFIDHCLLRWILERQKPISPVESRKHTRKSVSQLRSKQFANRSADCYESKDFTVN